MFSVFVNQRRKSSKGAVGPKARRTPVVISHLVLVCSGMVLMFLIQFLLPPEHRWFHREINAPAPSSYTTTSRNGLARPWGDIAYMPLALSRPDAYFTNVPPPPEKTEWTLRNTSRAALSTLIGSLGLEDRERNFLSDSSHW